MSEFYTSADLSLAFNQGHNDGWCREPPREPKKGTSLSDLLHQKYRAGHVAGTTARYYYDAGYQAAQREIKERTEA